MLPPRLRCATHFRPAPPGPRHPAFGPVRHPHLHVEGVQRVELQEPAADVVWMKPRRPIARGTRSPWEASMSSRLLPPNRSSLERSLGDVLPGRTAGAARELNDPARCEAALFPTWPGRARWTAGTRLERRGQAQCGSDVLRPAPAKGTPTALRQVVEPIGALSEVTEW